MKKFTIVLLLCLACYFSKAQRLEGLQIGAGYTQTTFINSQFGTMLKNESIKRPGGYNINVRFVHHPIMVDVNFFNTSFKVENNPDPAWTFADTSKIRHAGMELGLAIPIMFSSKYFIPYLGVAYQNGFLGINVDAYGNPVDEDLPDEQISVTKIEDFLWRAGLMLNLGNRVSLIGEYKQSFDSQSERALGQWKAILSFRVWKK